MDLFGESILAATGLTAALEPGPLKLTIAKVKQAAKIPETIAARLREYCEAPSFEKVSARPPFDYEKTRKLMPAAPFEPWVAENIVYFEDMSFAEAYAAALGRVVALAQAKLPVKEVTTLVRTVNVPPSALTLDRYRREYAILDNPLRALDLLCEGTLLTSEVDLLGEGYPAMLAEMRACVGEALAEVAAKKGEKWVLPRAKERRLHVLLGDDALEPGKRAAVREVHAEAQEKRAKAAKASGGKPKEYTKLQELEQK